MIFFGFWQVCFCLPSASWSRTPGPVPSLLEQLCSCGFQGAPDLVLNPGFPRPELPWALGSRPKISFETWHIYEAETWQLAEFTNLVQILKMLGTSFTVRCAKLIVWSLRSFQVHQLNSSNLKTPVKPEHGLLIDIVIKSLLAPVWMVPYSPIAS